MHHPHLESTPLAAAWLVVLLLLATAVPGWAGAQPLDSQAVFERHENAVFQVQVINRETGKKSSIGSGFVYGLPDRLATNYHVVSRYIEQPDAYDLRYLAADGSAGPLALTAVDAVHDLALVRAPAPLGRPLAVAEPPPKGAALFAMGNPLDLGLTIAAGTNGGVLSQTDAGRILFSGSLNPGMSGGPTFDDRARVVGINVSTARNDISFIVPARFLEPLTRQAPGSPKHFLAEIDRQIFAYQSDYLARIADAAWTPTQVRRMQVPGAISETIRCWDASPRPREENRYRRLSISCKNENPIYLTDRLEVGKILYEYIWVESDDLPAPRFYRLYEALNSSSFGGRANEDDVERFRCETAFVDVAGQPFKSTVCVRRYKNYPNLSDILFTAAMVGRERTGFIFNLDLSGTDFNAASRLIARFLREMAWQS